MFNKIFFSGILLTLFFAINANSQSLTLHGTVTDSNSKQPLPSANLIIKKLGIGASSNQFGIYEIKDLRKGKYEIRCSFIGYKSSTKSIFLDKNLEINFALEPKAVLLDESIVEAGKAKIRETPVAFSEKTQMDIERELGSQDVPHLLSSTPSLYIASQGGGTGDLRMNMRGFDQTHFAVMVNGIPINNPENGEIYWSNWSGISDVVDEIQVQRGLTANPYSSAAVGGLLNIKTVGVNSKNDFLKIHSEFGADYLQKYSVAFSQHLIPEKLSVTGFVSKRNWNGYADQTYLKENTYYLGIGGVFGNQSLELKMINSPQEHGQRMTRQTVSTWELRGKNYNPDWGYLQGKPLNLRDNKYSNPTISLTHNWQIKEKLSMSNLFYFIPGSGGGTVPPWVEFDRTESGQINFDKEFQHNSNNIDSTYSPTLNKTENALRFFDHTHKWFGFLSTIKYVTDFSTYTLGIDFRYYKANNHQKVSNLLGGDYTIGWAGFDNQYQSPLFIGDKIDFDADSFAKHYGAFVQYEFNNNFLSYYFNSTVSFVGYNRIDYFNYKIDDPQRETGWENFIGFSLKSGMNFNLNRTNNIFLNIGAISKPPLVINVFDYSNKIFPNVKNENVYSAEIGYGYKVKKLWLNINSFFTIWENKAFNRTEQDWTTGQFYLLSITGADSKHYGIEAEFKYKIFHSLSFNGMLSISKNIFTSNAITARFPENNPTNVEYLTSYVDGIYLPNFPMTTVALSFEYLTNICKGASIFIKPILTIAANQYAQFDPTARADESEKNINSWKLPASYLLNINFALKYQIKKSLLKEVDLSFHIFNIQNQDNYIIDALDGKNHDEDSALVWYGRERWWDVGISLNF